MPGSNLRFLVVEDHEFQRRVMVQLLRYMGARTVHAAADGAAALQVMRDPDRPVDIVICDLSMPGMDGMEFIRHLSETGDRVSLILASSLEPELLASVANMARAYKVKLLGAIVKPATAAKLAPLLEKHRSAAAAADGETADSRFSLAEIADAWTYNEFEPWFEPRINLESGEVQGMHATPRWRNPIKGLIAPDAFMPSVQARGLNDDFVWQMLQKCAAQCRGWQARHPGLVVSVNLSFQSLTDLRLAQRVRQIALNEAVEPNLLVLGVTEEVLNTDLARALENLARLRVDGFGLAVDDFGSGRMAIEQLSLVAFTELKIKSSFVTDADCDDAARAGLAVALEAASQLKVKTVADGIRSKEEWKLLHEWGCQLGQGPFMAAPMEAAAVPGWLARWSGSTIQ
jgi:EAL domain-containing protein (putative c-di-GMP-specific phosphodiesterase class I)/AmiR/NasT family two-component response regulator